MKNLILCICVVCFSITASKAQETKEIKKAKVEKEEKIYIKVKNDKNPDIYIDGKKYDYAILELLDQNKIAAVNVVKGEQAMKEYNAPNGVIFIQTIENKEEIEPSEALKLDVIAQDKYPLVMIDGELASQKDLEALSPERIESIEVFKGEKAKSKYNAPNGAIIVKLKK